MIARYQDHVWLYVCMIATVHCSMKMTFIKLIPVFNIFQNLQNMGKRRQYSKDALEKAIESIRKKELTFGKAAKTFGIPKTTLIDKVLGKYRKDATPGASTVLTEEEEARIVEWIFTSARMGQPITKSQLLDCVGKYVARLGRPNHFKDGIPGRKWFKGFFTRHPDLARRVAQNLTTSRANITEEGIRGWFAQVHDYFAENNLLSILEDPSRIFNTDESAFFLAPQEKQVLAQKGAKAVYKQISNGEKENYTVLVTVSADGKVAPPLALFKYKRMPQAIASKIPETWSIGRTDSGWMTSESFFEYVANIFYPWLVKNNVSFPVVLFLDGHSSHINFYLSDFCNKHKIILVVLLANCTHLLQPLDVAIFHPLKDRWKKKLEMRRRETGCLKIFTEDFAPLLDECIRDTCTTETIASSFRTCGLYPFDANAVNFSKLIEQRPSSSLETDQSSSPLRIQSSSSSLEGIHHSQSPSIQQPPTTSTIQRSLSPLQRNQHSPSPSAVQQILSSLESQNQNSSSPSTNPQPSSLITEEQDQNIPELEMATVGSGIMIDESVWEQNDNMINLEIQNDGEARIIERTPEKIEKNATDEVDVREEFDNEVLAVQFDSPFKEYFPYPGKAKAAMSQGKGVKPKLLPAVVSSTKNNEEQLKILKAKEEKERIKQERVEMRKIKKEKTESGKKNPVKKKKKNELQNDENSTGEASQKNDLEMKKTPTEFNIGDYVVVLYEKEYFPGIITHINDCITVKTMEKCEGEDYWKWPQKDDEIEYELEDVICKISPPNMVNKGNHRVHHYDVPTIKTLLPLN